MKKLLLLPIFAVSALILSSCSTTQLAGQAPAGDDVYYTEAKAQVITKAPVTAQANQSEKSYRTDEQLYGDESSYDNRYNDDYYYSSRINRFYYNSPYRSYYDNGYAFGYNPWYTYSYDPFFYDPWAYRPGVSLWFNIGRPYYYGYYGSRYNNGYWGPYSYYDVYPGYGYGGYYGGYYGNGGGRYNAPSNPRPNRESGVGRAYDRIETTQGNGGIINTGRPNRGSAVQNNQPNGRVSSDRNNTTSQPAATSSRPTRTQAQPRQSAPEPAPRQAPSVSSRPERSSAPAPSSSGGNSGGSSSGGSSSGSRPSRGR